MRERERSIVTKLLSQLYLALNNFINGMEKEIWLSAYWPVMKFISRTTSFKGRSADFPSLPIVKILHAMLNNTDRPIFPRFASLLAPSGAEPMAPSSMIRFPSRLHAPKVTSSSTIRDVFNPFVYLLSARWWQIKMVLPWLAKWKKEKKKISFQEITKFLQWNILFNNVYC